MQSEQRIVIGPQAIEAGLEHHRAGRVLEAERIYQQALKSDPDNPDALHLLGVIALQTGKNALAVRLIAKAIHHRPSNAQFLNNLGEAYRGLRRPDEALASYDKALSINPDVAEVLSNRGIALHDLKRFEDALASYDKAIAIKPGHAEAWNNRAVSLIALKRFEEALSDCDAALRLKPGYAKALSNRGLALRSLKRFEDAVASYDKAIAIEPDYGEAFSDRGVALHDLNRVNEALASYDRAIAIKPDHADAFYNRGNALLELKRLEEALASYDVALTIKPDYAEALNNRGVALKKLGRFAEALASHAKAIAIKPDYADAHLNEGVCRLLMGDLEPGWAKYEWRWKSEFGPSETRQFARPLWLGEADIAGKTILLRAEQGLGDTIQFARYAQAVAQKGAAVVLEVQPALKALLSGVSGAHQVLAKGESLPAFDFHCPLMSLPLALGTRLETLPAGIPYLSAGKAAVSAWRRKLAVKRTRLVGMCWKGSPGYRGDGDRSMRLAELRPLFACPGVRFVSLQKELDEEELAITAGMKNFVHPGADFKSTAEMIGALDLVISVDTAWAHWAGAIGKPVWVLLPDVPHWCWLLERKDSPWYPTARLFRQSRSGGWRSVIKRVKQEIVR